MVWTFLKETVLGSTSRAVFDSRAAGPIQSNTCTNCVNQFYEPVQKICSKESIQTSPSLTNRTSLRQIRGCFDARMRLGQAAVDVIELHDSPLSGPEFTSEGNANR